MKLQLLNIDGNKTETIDVSDKVINLKVNHKLIKYVVDWQLNHLKPRLAKTKQRNEVKGSTRKIVPQKGTGSARHASKKAPLFVGGGVAHGPKGNNYKIKKINYRCIVKYVLQGFYHLDYLPNGFNIQIKEGSNVKTDIIASNIARPVNIPK